MKALKWRMPAVLLAVLLVFLSGFTGCNTFKKDRGEETTADPSVPPADIGDPYTLFFESNGDGTCVLKRIETNLDYRWDFVLEIPAVSPDGDKVVGIETKGFSFCELPNLILKEDFERLLAKAKEFFENTAPYKDAILSYESLDGADSYNFHYRKFRSYYFYKSLENCKTEEDRQFLIDAFPIAQKADFYVLDAVATDNERAKMAMQIQLIDPDYIFYEDERRMEETADDRNMDKFPFHDRYTHYGRYIKEIRIAEGIEYIGDEALSGCTRLEKVILPSTVTKIGPRAFGCSGLTITPVVPPTIVDVTYNGTVSDWEAIEKRFVINDDGDVESWIDDQSIRVHCSDGVLEFGIPEEEVTNTPSVPETDPSEETNEELSPVYVDGLEYTSNGDGTCYVSGLGNCSDQQITVPAVSSRNERVIAIGSNAFKPSLLTGKSVVTHITVSKGITTIESNAFSFCDSLVEIVLPEGLTSIGSNAFYSCQSLVEIVLPEGVTDIGSEAFGGCYSLTGIRIPSTVISIGEAAFSGCVKLSSITVVQGNPVYHHAGNCVIDTQKATVVAGCNASVIPTDGSVVAIGDGAFTGMIFTGFDIPQGVVRLGKRAFYACARMTAVTLPDGLEIIGDQAFGECVKLANPVIPDSVRQIGNEAFRGCDSITQMKVPENLENTEFGIFQDCRNLQSVEIPKNYTSIAGGAFMMCVSLKSITIHGDVTFIGTYAFAECRELESITLPASLTQVDSCAFAHCGKLTDIYYSGTQAEWKKIEFSRVGGSRPSVATIHCTDGDITPIS